MSTTTDTTTQAIDDKSSQQQNDNTEASSETNNINWGGFISWLILWTIITVGVSIIGANFITIINYPSFSFLLPTEESKYFKQNKTRNQNTLKQPRNRTNNSMPCKNSNSGKGYSKIGMPSMPKFGIDGTEYGWPYTMFEDTENYHSLQSFKNWFAQSTSKSYISMREILSKLDSDFLINLPPLALFMIAPFVLLFATLFIPLFTNLLVLPFNAFNNEYFGWGWTLLGLLFGWDTLMISGNIFIQTLQILFFFLVTPFIVDLETVKSVLNCKYNRFTLGMFFGLGIVIGGYNYLSTTIGVIMSIVWFVLLLMHFL